MNPPSKEGARGIDCSTIFLFENGDTVDLQCYVAATGDGFDYVERTRDRQVFDRDRTLRVRANVHYFDAQTLDQPANNRICLLYTSDAADE